MSRRRIGSVLGMMGLSLAVMLYAGSSLRQTQREYAAGDAAYDEIVQTVITTGAPADRVTYGPGAAADEAVEGLDIGVDYHALSAISPDAIAWLYSPDTWIDYPVMRARDYDEYLYTLPGGGYSVYGSLFLDFNSPPDFSGRTSVIYGHNMNSGRMFGTLRQYKSQSYFNEHPYLYLYTKDCDYRVDVMCGAVTDASEWVEKQWMNPENGNELLEYVRRNSTFESGVSCTVGDSLLVLSTCSTEYSEARYVLIGVLRPVQYS